MRKSVEIWVGLWMVLCLSALIFLALKVSGLSNTFLFSHDYTVTAVFDNIGGLKVRSPVTLAGVRVGQVSAIRLDNKQFKAIVTLQIDGSQRNLPVDTTASILTQGLLGASYVSLKPGFDLQILKNKSVIRDTNSALILEDLIGQFIFNLKSSGGKI